MTEHTHYRILVVDDNRAIHDDFRKILGAPDPNQEALDVARAGLFGNPPHRPQSAHTIDSAFQGDEALRLVRQALAEHQPYAMAFVDVRMPPGFDGIETTTKMWELDPDLQIVICTAYADYSWEKMVERTDSRGSLLVLKKPFDTIEVLQLAHALTEKWMLGKKNRRYMFNLGAMVNQRTSELLGTNERLRAEIAERVRDAAQIREQAALLDAAQDAIVVRDMDGVIRFWNASAERLYGWTASEAMGRDFDKVLGNKFEKPNDALATLLERGHWIGEVDQTTKYRVPITVECHWTLVRQDSGEPKSILGIHTDVTERKQLEAQLFRAQRLESIGILAGGIAHDLNNVLAPIMMALEILQSRFADEEADELLSILSTSAQRGAGMVKQVLQFARGIEGGRIILNPSHIIRELRTMMADTFPKDISIETSAGKGIWTIDADPTQLHQVLLNLCVNARDAMPSGGSLQITAENFTIEESGFFANPEALPGPYLLLKVADTGTGMPPAVQARIFDPFFSTKEADKGTGLGLSTTLSIVKSHHGFIEVESEPGKGSVFKVFLPASVNASVAPEEHAPAWPVGHGELILVIDDEKAIREITRDTLNRYGYRTLTAADGADAITLFRDRRNEIDIVMTDIAMPVMDGAATIRAVKSLRPGIRIIAASGLGAESWSAMEDELGVDAFLAKPFTTETLLTTLEKTLHNGGKVSRANGHAVSPKPAAASAA